VKKVVLILSLVFCLSIMAVAAPNTRELGDAEILKLQYQLNVANLFNALELSNEQLQQMYDLVTTTRGNIEVLNERVKELLETNLDKAIAGEAAITVDRTAVARRAQAIIAEYYTGIKSIITVNQAEKLASYLGARTNKQVQDIQKRTNAMQQRVMENLPQVQENLKERLQNLPPEVQKRLEQMNVPERLQHMREQIASRTENVRPNVQQRTLQNRVTLERLALGLLTDPALEVMEKMLDR